MLGGFTIRSLVSVVTLSTPDDFVRTSGVGRTLRHYGLAVLCVGVAFIMTRFLGSWASPDFTALYVLAVLLTSLVGGLGAGLLATLLSAASVAYTQVGSFSEVDIGWDDVFRAAVFIVTAVVVSSLAARRRAAEQELRDAIEQLRQADLAKDDFLATLSHELRTPLTSILGWATILEDGGGQPETVAAAAASIKQSARSQQYIVDDLLDLSRIIFSKFRIEMRPVDLITLVREVIDLIKPLADAKRVQCRIDLPLRPCVITGDAERIKQVIWNFASNAVKFTPPGGRIVFRLEVVDSQAQISVSDSGEGIEPDLLPRVFDRFRQGNGAASKPGLGLGLAISRHIVEAHHGSVGATSDGRGKGATFIARFPLTFERQRDAGLASTSISL